MEAQYKEKLDEAMELFDRGQIAYKAVQNIIQKTDFKIHSEFGYYARALTTVMKLHQKADYGDSFKSSLDDLLGSARYIVNDVLDLLVSYAEIETAKNNQICETTTTAQVYSDYHKAMDVLNDIAQLTEETRGKRGVERVSEYLDVFKSDSYIVLRAYCNAIPRISDDLKVKRKEEIVLGRRFITQIAFTVLFGVVSVAILLKVNWASLFS